MRSGSPAPWLRLLVPRRGERDLLGAGDASLDGCLVYAQKRREPHAVLYHDNIGCPFPALLPRKPGDGIGHQRSEPVEIPVKSCSINLCVVLIGLREGPKVQSQGQVPCGQQFGARNPPQGLAQLFVRGRRWVWCDQFKVVLVYPVQGRPDLLVPIWPD
jgi:hypothetical protein